MVEAGQRTEPVGMPARDEALVHLRESVDHGVPWAVALFQAMAMWAEPEETMDSRHYRYFIGGEAFDWLLLAERLMPEIADLVPGPEQEDLLFRSVLPDGIEEDQIQRLLGVEKYRGYLNYHYGVTVEEALQLAVEQEVIKRYASNGMRHLDDPSEDAFTRIYGAPRTELVSKFRETAGTPGEDPMSLSECKEFTYWLFKFRLWRSDKPRIASDTKKGLEQLEHMRQAARSTPRSYDDN